MKTWQQLAAAVAFGAVGFVVTPAQAAVLTLVNPAPADQQYQQTLNSPCIFGEPSCKDPVDWDHVDFAPNTPSQTLSTSTLQTQFTIGQIRAVVGDSFIVGIDINTTTSPDATEQLDFFDMWIGGAQAYVYDPATPGTTFKTANNGNGYADALLTGFSIAGLDENLTVVFNVTQNGGTDGREQYFLITTDGTPPPIFVPEPGSIALVGLGLLSLAAARRRRSVTP